jgi:hypothetical protein
MLVRMSMVSFLFIYWKWFKIEPPWSNLLYDGIKIIIIKFYDGKRKKASVESLYAVLARVNF